MSSTQPLSAWETRLMNRLVQLERDKAAARAKESGARNKRSEEKPVFVVVPSSPEAWEVRLMQRLQELQRRSVEAGTTTSTTSTELFAHEEEESNSTNTSSAAASARANNNSNNMRSHSEGELDDHHHHQHDSSSSSEEEEEQTPRGELEPWEMQLFGVLRARQRSRSRSEGNGLRGLVEGMPRRRESADYASQCTTPLATSRPAHLLSDSPPPPSNSPRTTNTTNNNNNANANAGLPPHIMSSEDARNSIRAAVRLTVTGWEGGSDVGGVGVEGGGVDVDAGESGGGGGGGEGRFFHSVEQVMDDRMLSEIVPHALVHDQEMDNLEGRVLRCLLQARRVSLPSSPVDPSMTRHARPQSAPAHRR